MKIRSTGIATVTKQIPCMSPAPAMGIGTLRLMKTRLTMLKLLIILCSAFATTAAFGQTIYSWTGAANGTNLATAGNWDPNGLPSGATQDTAQWDGRTTTNLVISYTTAGLGNTGFGTSGINLLLTPNQVNSVQIISSAAVSAGVGIFGITNNSAAATLTLGETNTANQLLMFTRPGNAGTVHSFVNNSSTAVIMNPSVQWQAGGGVACVMDFGGTGDWIINHNLRHNNSGAGPITVLWEGPGTMAWTAGGTFLSSVALGPIGINGGTVILKSSGLCATFTGVAAGNNTITNNGALLKYDAAAADTISRFILGTGPLQVNNGTLTLSSTNTYGGNTILSGGELIAGGAETPGTSGPLGVGGTISFTGGTLGFSANNVFDYSSRFSTAASQAYSIDTGGQNVTLATGLSSSGGTLTKVGSGTLTLTGSGTYSGVTTVSVGKLVFQGSKTGSGNITAADFTALGVTATGTQVTPGTLTVGTSSGAALEFNNVNSTATAPLAAGTLSSAGTVTVNINSGTFTVGQSYPLLTWTSGSTPTVSLGILNGFIGNLSFTGNTLKLNITATAYKWTGANNGSWDTTTPNNWLQNGGPVTFANGGPALFDDTATRTNVTISGVVQPTTVTVNNSSLIYSITSSSGNDIGGSAKLTKSGNGLLTLSGGANAYTGVTTLSGGTVSVGALANGGSASDIGAAGNSAANLVLDGGTLQYTGGAAGIDRLFTLGTAGGTIDASGTGALNLNNSGALGYSGNGPRAFTLTGANTDTNTLSANLADNGGATTLTKNGAGAWVLIGTNTHSGATTIANGTLQIGTGGASGAIGSGNVVDNGSLIFNRSGTLTVSGTVSGTGPVTKDGSGTVILPGNNTYQGGTTINAGTLQIGNGGATGALDAGDAIVDNGVLIFNSTGGFTLSGVISGTGELRKQGSGLLKLIGANTYTGPTTVAAGAQLQIAQGNTGSTTTSVITNNGTLIFVRQDNGVLRINAPIVGTGSVTEDVNNPNAGDTTLTGTNTYAGGTFIRGGSIILGDNGLTPFGGSIVGNVIFTNSIVNDTFRSLTFNRAEDITFSGNITGPGGTGSGGAIGNAGSVVQNGFGTVTLTGTNTYLGGTTINAGALQVGAGGTSGSIGSGPVTDNSVLVFNRSDNVTLTNVISGGGSLVKLGSGTLTLNATNTYFGTTTVSNGTLVINADNAAVSTIVYAGTLGGTGTFVGPVTLEAGTTLAPGASVGTMTINSDLSIGGNLAIEVNKSLSPSNDLVVVSGVLTNTGTGTLAVANLGPALAAGNKFTLFSQPVLNGAALTVKGSGAIWTNNLAVDGSISVIGFVAAPTLNFTQTGNSLQFSWTGDFKLQAQTNSLNVGISNNWANYPGGSPSPVTVPIDATKGTVFFRLVPTP